MDKKTTKNTNSDMVKRLGRGSRRTVCWFCENEVVPDYKSVEVMKSFLSPRGKILSRKITGICAKHQRSLSSAIKIARHLALIR